MNVSTLELPSVTALPVRIEGGWRVEYRRWTWKGLVIADEPTALLLLIQDREHIAWSKSLPHVAPELEFWFAPLGARTEVQLQYSVEPGGYIRGFGTVISEPEYRPVIPNVREAMSGRYTRLAKLKGQPSLEVGFVVYAKRDLKVRRSHVWGLKEELLVSAPPAALAILHHGRSGTVPSAGA